MTTSATAPVRVVDGVELPAPGTWAIDPAHADVGFVARHFMVTKIRGRFPVLDGTIHIAEQPADTRVEVTLDIAGLSSGSDDRDAHLRSADFFDVEHHPTATFRSTAVEWSGSSGRLTGDLTIRDVTRPVTLDVEFLGHVADPWGGQRGVFSASTTVNREEWGLTWNAALETGGVVVSKDARLEIDVEAVYSG